MPGIRAVKLKSFVSLILATCLIAEFGFLGFIVVTKFTMPLTCGLCVNAGVREKFILWYFLFLKIDCNKVVKGTQIKK